MRKMTEGSIFRHLLAYAGPMIAGNILQLTYNAVDSVIVGKGAGVDALSAVSVSNPVSTIIILGISGIGIGASVLMSRFYGAGEEEKVKRALSTTLLSGTVISALVTMFGFLISAPLLKLLNVPEDILTDAVRYLRIIFAGILFTFFYNVLAAALRSVGDSATPVRFIGLSSVLNGCMDAVFIFAFGLGVTGAALATFIAEGISAVLCLFYINRHVPVLKLELKDLKFDREMFGEIMRNGSVTALQQSCQPIGKLLIQGVINLQGVGVISAFNAVSRIDDFCCIPTQSIGSGIMTCTAQNLGAGQKDRARATLRTGNLIGLMYYPIIGSVVWIFKEPLMRCFAPAEGAEAMVAAGVSYLSLKAFFFIFPCFTNAVQGYFRGNKRMTVTLFATIIQISIRTVTVFLLVPKIGIRGEAWGCMAGWSMMLLWEYLTLFRMRKKGLMA